jgi:phospholipid/cholesterol/gamma-HCH transport system substrate-binding protein
MITRSQKARLGVFLALSGFVLLGGLGVLVGVRVGETFDRYTVRYKISVSGLEIGAPVKYNGVRVGKVAGIRVNPDDVSQILVALDVDHATPIKADVRATVTSVGITGLKYIDLTLGSNQARTLPSGSEIQAGESDLDFLTNKAQVISERVDLLLGQIIELTRADNIRRVDRILDDVSVVTSGVRERTDRLLLKAETLLDDLDVAVRETTETAAALRADLARVTASATGVLDRKLVEDVSTRASALLASVQRKVEGGLVDEVLRFVRDATRKAGTLLDNVNLTVVQSQDDVNRGLSQMLETIENLNDFSRMLREDPSVLLRGAEFEEKRLR